MMKGFMRKGMLAGILAAAMLTGTQALALAQEAESYEAFEVLDAEVEEAVYDVEDITAEPVLAEDEAVAEDETAADDEISEDGLIFDEEELEEAPAEDVSDDFFDEGAEDEIAEDEIFEFAEEEEPEIVTEESSVLAAPETSGTTGDVSWNLDGAVLTVSGTGAMADYTKGGDKPWKESAANITKVVVANGVTKIGSFAFEDLSKVTEADIPASVTVIGTQIFSVNSVVIKGSFKTAAEDYAVSNKLKFVPAAVTNISGAQATVATASYNYSGAAFTPAVTVKYSKTTLTQNTDYKLAYSNNINAGTAKVTITGIGNFSGSLTASFTIKSVSLQSASVSGIKKKGYAGPKGVTQSPTVTLGGKTLVSGKDYTLSYTNNVKPGKKAKVTITGKGNYNGSVTKTFTIKKASLKKDKAKVSAFKAKTYNGKKRTQKFTVEVNGGKLKKGKDYKVTYENNKNVGTATVIIKGKGYVKGTIKKTFKIKKASLADADVKGITDKSYTGSSITQSPNVVLEGKTLKADTDYKITYTNNVSVGTASLTIKGKGNYKGSISKNFKITKASLKNASVSGLKAQGYTGKAVKPKPVVKVAGRTLREGSDYSLKYENNVNVGTAYVTITGKGNYKDALRVSFTIKVLPISEAKITGIEDKTYNGGRLITQSIKITMNGTTLKPDTDYSIAYTNNSSIGRATMTIRGLGTYTGTVTKTFNIVPQGTTVVSASISNSRLFVQYRQQTVMTDGYMVQYSPDSSFNSYKTVRINGNKPTSVQISGVNQAQRLYVRIRTYKVVNNVTYYSKWSPAVMNGAEA